MYHIDTENGPLPYDASINIVDMSSGADNTLCTYINIIRI